MRKQDKIVVWPAYFDSTRTRGKGRKLPKNLCIPSPKIGELKKAADRLKLGNEIILDAAYPKTPWVKSGLLLIAKKEPKNAMLKKIATELINVRNEARTESKKKDKKARRRR